jgi:dTDP-4-amino-4,6-dideoxygalactose transaminase
VKAPYVAPEATHAVQSYVTTLPDAVAPSRAAIIKTLRERGIEANIGTWHMPMTTYFRTRYGFRPGDFPVADKVFARSLTLPLYEGLLEADLRRVVDEVRSLVG